VRLFNGTPTYYGEGAVASCHRRDLGVFGWLAQLLGFPRTPCYATPTDPPIDPCMCPPQPPQPPPVD